ncbi:MAG: DUF3990 domain-containing protein [Acidobacteria bacterium]|nr:DUF3990 domain-containing protein [Acidobacteriota bacterium]
MSVKPNVLTPPPWTNQPLTVFHGTNVGAARRILKSGIDLNRARQGTDFGPGFYVTTLQQQAWNWSVSRFEKDPTVLRFRLDRLDFGRATCLFFLDAGVLAEDYWSFVWACRRGATKHHAIGYYDVVGGPFASTWRMRTADPAGNQLSFHTSAGVSLLGKGEIIQ